MSPTFQDGFERVLIEGVTGIASYLILESVLVSQGYGWAIIFLNVISIFGIIQIMDKIKYWSIGYVLGWILSFALVGSYLYSWWEWPIYLLIGGFSLYVKLQNKF